MNELNVMVIMPHGRAGSVLVQSLFDGHPEVVSFPWIYDNVNLNISETYDVEQAIDWFICKNNFLFSTKHPDNGILGFGNNFVRKLGPNCDEDFEIDLIKFKEICLKNIMLYEVITIDKKILFNLVHISLFETLGHDVSRLKYILVHIHCYHPYKNEMFKFVEENYPNAYFLMLMRDCRETVLNFRKVIEGRKGNENQKLFFFKASILYIDNILRSIDKVRSGKYNVKIIDLNRLHFLGEDGLINMCSFLNIEFNDALLTTTIGNKVWHGNASDKKKETGLNKNRSIYQWPNLMSKKEKDFLSTQLKDINSIFGYDAGELNSRLVQKTYYLYFVLLFALDFLYSLIQINNLSSYDKNMLKSINTKKDILNKEYHKYPLSVAKLLIMYKMIKNRHLIKIRSNIIFLNVLIKDIFGKKNLIIPLDKDLFL